jgi:outer membrane biogenesis lipoprotein LolB
MNKKVSVILFAGVASILLSACAGESYNYDNRSYNEKKVDKVIATEMNSLSDADIAQINKLK